METKNRTLELDKLTLQIIAMAAMLLDHVGGTFFPEVAWLRYIGRLAFPIFAFLAAEGCEKTHSLSHYIRRVALFAVISEIPYDFRHGNWWSMGSQNVMWTLLIALVCIYLIKKTAEKEKAVRLVAVIAIIVFGFLLGNALHTDYGGWGVLTVLLFWGCRKIKWRYSGEMLGLSAIHWRSAAMYLLKYGELAVPAQGLCIFSLPLIWLYRGKQGAHSKVIQYACYAFYPVHLAIIGVLATYIL